MKYKSDAYEALHDETIANFKVGAISETELREFEKVCFVQEDKTAYEHEKPDEHSVRVLEHATV